MDDLMTSTEVSKLFRVHRISLYRWIKTSSLPAHRIGGRWRFSRREVLGWMKSFHAQPVTSSEDSSPSSQPAETPE